MFGKGFGTAASHDRSDRQDQRQALDFLRLASSAQAAGDRRTAVYMYLSAFESAGAGDRHSVKDGSQVVEGLREAFRLAVALKDRALAEHVFDRLEPFAGHDEAKKAGKALQKLALDRLEGFGFDRSDVERISNAVSDGVDDLTSLVAHPSSGSGSTASDGSSSDGQEAVSDGSDASDDDRLRYDDLVGYGRAIEGMRRFGVGADADPELKRLIDMLSAKHGVAAPPRTSSLLFRAYAREDADRFMDATANEVGGSQIRMFMDENPQGFPVLCVSATADVRLRRMHDVDALGPCSLVLEDVDLWGSPVLPDGQGEDYTGRFTSGARQAIDFIRDAVANPKVTVMASCAADSDLDDFFYDLLDPMEVVDVDVPDAEERAQVWCDAMSAHPSLASLDLDELVRASANMSRYDIYQAAREAVAQAFDEGMKKKAFVPVTMDNVLNKVAAYQPLDSKEYKSLEDEAIASLRAQISEYDDQDKANGLSEREKHNGNHPTL